MTEIGLDRRRIVVGGIVLLVLLAVAGRYLLRSGGTSIPPPVRVAAPTSVRPSAQLFVDVVGAVRRPGLYRLREGSRVADAVTRAGGPSRAAQLELLNLAARIADGEQIVVPRRGAVAPGGDGAFGGAQAPTGPVHLSSATLEQLDAIPGIGPAHLAQLQGLVAP